MTPMKPKWRSLLAALLLSAAAVPAAEAREMRVSSFEPAQGFYSVVIQEWIDQINPKLSEGNAFKLYPGSILGAPPAQAELVKKGVADVALIVPSYTPGLFPLTGVVEVPGMSETSANGTAILSALTEDGALDAEYADYKVIALFATSGYRLLMADKAATSPADVAGLKIRTPSPYGSKLLEMMGAAGVSIPAPQVYENLERHVVSGAAWVMDAYRTFRLNEVAPNVTSLRFTASPLAIVMNRKTYEALPEADRAVIDAFAGRVASEWVSTKIEAKDAENEAFFRAEGKVTFVDLTPEQQAAWDAALADAPAAWVAMQPDQAAAQAALDRAAAIAKGQ